MSPRAACRLESFGFAEVHDYVPGKVDWLARGLPTDGELADETRAGDVAGADVATCAPGEPALDVAGRIDASRLGFALVLSDRRIVLGRLRQSAIEPDDGRTAEELMESGPSTVRAHVPAKPLVQRLRERNLTAAVVTSPDGELIGVVRREDAQGRLGP